MRFEDNSNGEGWKFEEKRRIICTKGCNNSRKEIILEGESNGGTR
jgi:hypothetical protein